MSGLDVVSAAFERAWKAYLLINRDVDENDARRAALERFIRKCRETGMTDAELLAVEGLRFLKRIDQSAAGLPE